jgi:hypothetical protein
MRRVHGIAICTFLFACSSSPPDQADDPSGSADQTPRDIIGEDEKKVDMLADVCPPGADDAELCDALGALEAADPNNASMEMAAVEGILAARVQVAGDDPVAREQLFQSKPMQYFIRERAIGLMIFDFITDYGDKPKPPDYAAQVNDVLDKWYPQYPADSFKIAHLFVPQMRTPPACDEAKVAYVYFSGVLRFGARNEFEPQRDALGRVFGNCLEFVRVETDGARTPVENAQVAKRTVEALDASLRKKLPLHLIGHSQGSANSLQTLLDVPDIRRARGR